MVYCTDRSKAVAPVLVLLFVALWFSLRGDLFYVLPCFILFLCFSVLLALRLPRLGKRELFLVLFVRLFDLCLFGFVGFLFLLVSGKGCGLWLWHSLDFSLTFFFYTLFVCNIRQYSLKWSDNLGFPTIFIKGVSIKGYSAPHPYHFFYLFFFSAGEQPNMYILSWHTSGRAKAVLFSS